jgi:hypothetical protein
MDAHRSVVQSRDWLALISGRLIRNMALGFFVLSCVAQVATAIFRLAGWTFVEAVSFTIPDLIKALEQRVAELSNQIAREQPNSN